MAADRPAAPIRQCPDPSKCYGVGCHGCDEPVISKMAPGYTDAAASIDVRDCPKCENGTKGNYEGRVLIGGRGTFTCPVCGARWQDANEKPSRKGIPIDLRGTRDV